MSENEDMSMKEFMSGINSSMKKIQIGDIIKGKVLSVTDDEVIVNIGYMTDGLIPKSDFHQDDVNLKDMFTTGDEIYVYIEEINDGEGNVLLSKEKADSFKVWDEFEDSLKNDKAFNVRVDEIVKGGAIAHIKGVRAFIPISQLSVAYVKNADEFLNRSLLVKVIEMDREKEKVILSRKEVEKAEIEGKKSDVLLSIKPGEKRKGTVSNITKYGAFVDLGGVDGLIHISEMSSERVKSPSDIVSLGDVVEVYVLDVDREKGRISLSLKDKDEEEAHVIEYKDSQDSGNATIGDILKDKLKDFKFE